ncbi:MAG: C39 family peptidase [Eubacteriales bacterium]|nr:C39 family peptidase [Eubacteriales bacterium]
MNQEERKKQLKKRIKISAAVAAAVAVLFAGGRFFRKQDLRIQSVWAQNAVEAAKSKSEEQIFIEVPYLSQQNGYPTGCECASTAMLLQFWGYNYTIDDLITQFLPMEELTVNRAGQLTGPSPSEAFIGNPYLETGYGCYAPVIYDILEKATKWYHEVKDLTGMTLDQICQEYLDQGIPVLCWATINMNPSYDGTSWILDNGTGWFTWKAQEHCMVLVGYDDNYYYFNDPYRAEQVVQWERGLAQTRYEELGSQALAIV